MSPQWTDKMSPENLVTSTILCVSGEISSEVYVNMFDATILEVLERDEWNSCVAD